MNIEYIREYCLLKPGTTESFPFDEDTLVFKVADKIFALASLDGNLSVNLKCDPERATDLRERFDFVRPGYHMNKRHWITVHIEEKTNKNLVMEWIDQSYELVLSGLSKAIREKILKN
jgi:predicted DNA-binding protein (MmcQ/YjbR family)